MLNALELKAQFARKGVSQKDVAKLLGISPETLRRKMKRGVFGSDEIQTMIVKLDIKDPMAIFFAK